MNRLAILLSIILVVSCTVFTSNKEPKKSTSIYSNTSRVELSVADNEVKQEKQVVLLNLDSILRKYNLVDIQLLDSSIKVDIKYFTDDNFMKIKLYNSINKAYFQLDVAKRIVKCQQFLKSLHPNYSLLIYDAVRPVSVQQKMWDALDSLPKVERGKFVSNPANRSMHNFGAAIDVTIADENGSALDMGANYDDIRKIAYPSLEESFLASGLLTKKQIENRRLLRKVMTFQKFRNIPTEWWHFNACSKSDAIAKYKLLLVEPE